MTTIRRLLGRLRTWASKAGTRRRAIDDRRAATIRREPGSGTPPTWGP